MRKAIAFLLLFFILLGGTYAIGFAPSIKTVYFTNGVAHDYFTFSNPTGELYTCSIATTPTFSASYSAGNPFSTSETALQIIGTYSIPPAQLPMPASMSLSCTKGTGGQQSIINQFSRTLTFQVAPTTTTTVPPTTIPTTTTSVLVTTTTTTPTTTTTGLTTIVGSTTTSTIKPITTTTKQTTTSTIKPVTSTIFPVSTTTIFKPITTTTVQIQNATQSTVPQTTVPIQPELNMPILAILALVLVSGGMTVWGVSK